jgi:predicted flap endonuclease-1-like 5' DNA nuclease
MFARNRDLISDELPLWAWFLILPGIVLVSVLLIRRLRFQARISTNKPGIDQEFRLETSRHETHQPDERHFAGATEESAEFAWSNRRAATVQAGQQAADTAEAANSSVPEETQVAEEAAQISDDLKIIEGIGPKIEVILKNAGILTFRQLANSSVEQLYQVLHSANLRLADPNTWPEQARLAANGNWDFLKALQDRTKAGRRSIED